MPRFLCTVLIVVLLGAAPARAAEAEALVPPASPAAAPTEEYSPIPVVEYFAGLGGELVALIVSVGVGGLLLLTSNYSENSGLLGVGAGAAVFAGLAPTLSSCFAHRVARGDGRQHSWAGAFLGGALMTGVSVAATAGLLVTAKNDNDLAVAASVGVAGLLLTPLVETLTLQWLSKPGVAVALAPVRGGALLAAQLSF
jgi:hypothetical protein